MDFDPDSLRTQLPKAVSALEWAISQGNGRVYVHCTAGLGRAPAVAIAYMFWFKNMDVSSFHLIIYIQYLEITIELILLLSICYLQLNTAYDKLTSKRPCGPNKRAIRAATYDLAKNDPWKEPFESLPEHAFEGISDWERKLIQDRMRALHEA